MKSPSTPFPTSGYYGKQYFCDRENETKTLLDNIKGGQSTILIAPRRIGKTGLVKHVLAHLPVNTKGVYMDILATEDIGGFLSSMATAIIKSFPESTRSGRNIWKLVKSLRPVLTFDPLSGAPQVTLDLKPGEAESHAAMMLGYLEKQKFRIVIAIDEFQQILKYPETNTDAMLRGIIQQLKNVVFIFSGSHQHLMTELFSTPSRPFYNSARSMKIDRIKRHKYKSFIHDKFVKEGKSIELDVIENMLEWTDDYTYYVQILCNRVFIRKEKQIVDEVWKEEADRILNEQAFIYYNYRELLTFHQWNLLKAIAKDNKVPGPTSKKFISDYSLGSPATVLRSLKALGKREMIYSDYLSDGKKFYYVNDIFFRRWVQNL